MLVEPQYLPQATEEDHGAHLFKGTGWNFGTRLHGGGIRTFPVSMEGTMKARRLGIAVALITTSFLGAPDMAAALPCGTTTLNNWLVSGFSCTVEDKTFSGFTYNSMLVPASSVGVGPASTTAGPGIGINALWNAGASAV